MSDSLADLLADNRVFQSLPEQVLQNVRAAAIVRRYPADTLIVRQGDPAETFQIIICGRAKMLQVAPDGQQIVLRYIEPGRGFGLTSVLEESDYTWSVQAIEGCLALVWHGETLIQLMERYPRIGVNAVRVMVLRTQEDQQRYLELLTKPVEQRVARSLLRLTMNLGRETDDGILIDVRLSREDLAEYSGTTLYSVSRVLRQWSVRGVVQTGREQVVIRDLDQLRKIAESPDSICDPGSP